MHGLGREATQLQGFVWIFATFARLSFGEFSAENSKTWLCSFSFIIISVEMLRFQSNQYLKLAPVLSRFCNGLFYSCSLTAVTWPLNGSEAGSDLVLIRTSLPLLCSKSSCSNANMTKAEKFT